MLPLIHGTNIGNPLYFPHHNWENEKIRLEFRSAPAGSYVSYSPFCLPLVTGTISLKDTLTEQPVMGIHYNESSLFKSNLEQAIRIPFSERAIVRPEPTTIEELLDLGYIVGSSYDNHNFVSFLAHQIADEIRDIPQSQRDYYTVTEKGRFQIMIGKRSGRLRRQFKIPNLAPQPVRA